MQTAVCMMGLFDAQERGKRFSFAPRLPSSKCAAAWTNVLYSGSELSPPSAQGGLVAVGSYVNKTTRQLERLLQLEDVAGIELGVEAVLGPEREREIARVAQAATAAISTGIDAVIYTSRTRETIHGKAGDLQIGKRVSTALIEAVKCVAQTPRFLIAKGGITSSDVARGLQRTQRRDIGADPARHAPFGDWVRRAASPACHTSSFQATSGRKTTVRGRAALS